VRAERSLPAAVAGVGVRAHGNAITAELVRPRAVSSSPGAGSPPISSAPNITSPVPPSMETRSPSCTTTSPTVMPCTPNSIASAPHTAGMPQPRATTAACDAKPPCEVTMPSDNRIAISSAGLVAAQARMTCSTAIGGVHGVFRREVHASCGAG
jgi:hypothetical protein